MRDAQGAGGAVCGGGPGPVHSTDGMFGLSEGVPPGGPGIDKGLADDVLNLVNRQPSTPRLIT